METAQALTGGLGGCPDARWGECIHRVGVVSGPFQGTAMDISHHTVLPLPRGSTPQASASSSTSMRPRPDVQSGGGTASWGGR